MPPRVETRLVAERDTDLIVRRQNLDTRTPGKSVIAKAVPSDHIDVRGSGADAGTGDVSFWLKKTGVKPGLYNQFKTDEYGRIIEASYVESTGGSGSSVDTIWNQSATAQDANFWIDGNGRVDGSLVAGSLTTGSLSVTGAVTFASMSLGSPLPVASGGTGVAVSAQKLFFAGPVAGADATPSMRAIVASDLPPIPFSYITSLPSTLALHGINDGVTIDTTQSIAGAKTFQAAPLMSAGLEFSSGTPVSTANKLYQVSSTLYWNGAAVGGGAPGNMVTTDTTQTITGTKTFDSVLTVNNRAVFASTMSVHGSVNTILVTANHDQSSGAAWALTAATRFRGGAGANSDAKGHTSFTTFQDSVGVASAGLNKARGFYAVAAQNDSSDSNCGTYYGYSTLTGSGAGVTTFTEYASFAVDDENYLNAAFTNRYGLFVKTGNVTPSAGWFGVYIQDAPASPSRYSIYTGNAPSRFGGSIELPSFTPVSTTNRLYNVSGALYWNGAPFQYKLTTTSEAPSSNLSMTSAWVNRHTRVAPTATLNVVVEPGIAAISDEISLLQENTNFFVLTAGSGVTLRCATSQTTIQPRARYSNLRLICIAANTFDVIGDFVP
jgi:hypothetical protein